MRGVDGESARQALAAGLPPTAPTLPLSAPCRVSVLFCLIIGIELFHLMITSSCLFRTRSLCSSALVLSLLSVGTPFPCGVLAVERRLPYFAKKKTFNCIVTNKFCVHFLFLCVGFPLIGKKNCVTERLQILGGIDLPPSV